MRYVIIGLGAIGGTLAGLLHAAGREVVGVAHPGQHLDAIRTTGLLIRRHERDLLIELDARVDLAAVDFRADDVVVLAVKSQDTTQLLQELSVQAPESIQLVCAQNGVSNELEALRYFDHVHGAFVQCPALHLEPGVVVAYSSPIVGIVDLGPYPSGRSEVAERIADDLRGAGFSSEAVGDIGRWKYAKLLTNVSNSVEVVCSPEERNGRLSDLLRAEARAVFAHLGISYASAQEQHGRSSGVLHRYDVGSERPGGSVWQSVRRGQQTEVDHLCGEIVRLARLGGRTAPANALLQRLTRDITWGVGGVGSMSEQSVLQSLDATEIEAVALGNAADNHNNR